jgi:hypothetical protein
MKQLLLVALFLFNSKPIGACECLRGSINQQVKSTSYLLIGRALKVIPTATFRANHPASITQGDTLTSKYITSFLVEESLKGKLRVNDTVLISTGFSSCAMSLESNSRYVLFLHAEKGLLTPTDCSYSSKLYDEPFTKKLMKRIYRAAK